MAEDQDTNHSRLGVFGDVPTRVMTWVVRRFPGMPGWVETGILYFFTMVVFLLAHQQRRSILSNLRVVFKDLSWAEGYVGVFLVFRNFGWACVDSIRARCGQDVITWEVEGREVFERIRGGDEAAILFTTHTGSYDLAAALFAHHFGRTLHTVRVPERSRHLQAQRERELERDMGSQSGLKVLYNEEGGMLGVELARLLSEGGLVAIQCDRVIGEVVGLDVPLADCGASIRIPKGPMTLACFAKCPCYPLYVVRDRYRHYRVIFEPPLEVFPVEGKRKLEEMDVAGPWVERLSRFLGRHAWEWFVFEDAFVRLEAADADSKSLRCSVRANSMQM